ncbi:MAG: metallophosphoesterase [Comamonadaceae bacterium]|nr:MAG: metallophosphoesterase [Comamonadaceae bacterium]
MSALLQISDPHFGCERPAAMQALEALARDIAPALIVLSGDITQRATRAQFRAARAFVDRLGVPVLAIPGNHDIPLYALGARLLSPYARYSEAFGNDLEPHVLLSDWQVIGVNTTRWWRHENGVVSAEQARRVASQLSQARPQQIRVVVTHQPVMVTREVDRANLLVGREAAVAQWARAGTDLILGGHIHLPFARPLHEGFGDRARHGWAVQAGTAISYRVRDGKPNSVNVLRPAHGPDGRACLLERWDNPEGAPRFTCVHSQVLPLGEAISPGAADEGRIT